MWNGQSRTGLHFLPNLLLVECKNWNAPVGSQEISYFATRLRQRNCDHGLLVAANGITGVDAELTAAHFQLATALASGVRILVFRLDELQDLQTTQELCVALKRKLCQLVVTGTLPTNAAAV
jgi:predicted Mrr-cat superfamily restriction endonuclease